MTASLKVMITSPVERRQSGSAKDGAGRWNCGLGRDRAGQAGRVVLGDERPLSKGSATTGPTERVKQRRDRPNETAVAAHPTNGPSGIRTQDRRIMSPLL